ncbi:YggT family protein [Clostridium sp. 19966]|uniref:YggT family protein n=1 Tax=Clostridium sp. 19966 TaxID=2768166 RepID=UPI0028DD8317|nr:YggT family protein [Clostridium sp. 19966]MDT8716613.1 YggT family protein [Clostridium sp. 19966]
MFISTFITLLINLLEWCIAIDIIISWVMPDKNNTFISVLKSLTEPLYYPGRKIQEKILPDLQLDLSPIVAYFILAFIGSLV